KQLIPPGFDDSLGALQQKVGMAIREYVHPDVWVRAACGDLESAARGTSKWVIFVGVRFLNEANAIRRLGGCLIRVNGDPTRVRNATGGDRRNLDHVSETALDSYEHYDYVIDNTGTMDELRERVRSVMDDIL